MNLAPMVIQRDGRGERAMDIWSLLLQKRIVFLGTPVNDEVANLVIAQLLYLQSEDSKTPINMYINSPGGSVTAGMAIHDTMRHISAPVARSVSALIPVRCSRSTNSPKSLVLFMTHSYHSAPADANLMARQCYRTCACG